MKKIPNPNNKYMPSLSEFYFFWGILFLVATLAASLSSYYLYSSIGRQFTFVLMILSLIMLFWGMYQDLKISFKSPYILWGILFVIITTYFLQRAEMHRFDFMVGDASDYFAAGICSVTYSQDIGYILPLSAAITAVGYEIFGIKNVLFSYIIFYLSSVPIFYYLFRKLNLSAYLSLVMGTFLIFIPLSIWYAKSSFTEPIWQILLFVFLINMYSISQINTLNWKNIIVTYMIFFLAPMLRVEGVFYSGLLTFLALFHFWKYSNYKIFIFSGIGLFIVAISTHITLKLRPDYLLHRQFNRIIPHATEENVMIAIYTLTILLVFILLLVYLFKKVYSKLPFPLLVTIFSITSKLGLAYIYAIKKHMSFSDMLFLNEYELAVGNFGLPITIMMIIGLVLLYMQALRGHILSLLLVVIYTIFYIPFVMQAVTFFDPHAFFFYWNRYYFSVFMMVHLFALGLSFQYLYATLSKYISSIKIIDRSFITFFILIIFSSMNIKLYTLSVKEAHLKGSYKLYDWVQGYIGEQPLDLVTESGIVYKQNARDDGKESIEYLIGRTFNIYKMPIKNHISTDSKRLIDGLQYTSLSKEVNYVLCVSTHPCQLKNITISKVDTLILPLEWREHFGLDNNSSKIHQGNLSKSVVKHLPLHATLYRVVPHIKLGKALSFKHMKPSTLSMFKEGWTVLPDSGMLAKKKKSVISLAMLRDNPTTDYILTLRYAIMDATKASAKTVLFSYNAEKIKEVSADSPYTRTVQLRLSKKLIRSQHGEKELTIETVPSGNFILRSLTLSISAQ